MHISVFAKINKVYDLSSIIPHRSVEGICFDPLLLCHHLRECCYCQDLYVCMSGENGLIAIKLLYH